MDKSGNSVSNVHPEYAGGVAGEGEVAGPATEVGAPDGDPGSAVAQASRPPERDAGEMVRDEGIRRTTLEQLLTVVEGLENELFLAEARRHEAEVRRLTDSELQNKPCIIPRSAFSPLPLLELGDVMWDGGCGRRTNVSWLLCF